MAGSDPTDIPEGIPADGVDALYGLPVDEFTPARDELAKELRAAGKRSEADWVKALRKPSAAAWLVNQLARARGQEADALVEAGERLRAAQERVIAGKSEGGEIAAAAAGQQEAVRALMAWAPGVLDREGRSPSAATLDKVEQTLRAVPVDEAARAEFAAGRLTREHRASGFGLPAAAEPAAPARRPKKDQPPPPKPRPSAAPATQKAEEERRRRAEEKTRARAALAEARDEQRARKKAVSERARDVKDAQREVERAERRLEAAAAALERAEAEAAGAEQRVAEAQAAVEHASRGA